MRFEPQLGTVLQIGEESYTFSAHPGVPSMVFGQEGRKAVVYQVKRTSDQQPYAFKIFKPAHRTQHILVSALPIAAYAMLPGMQVCQRNVLTKFEHSALITQYPELEYAVLMPWVGEQSWQDVVLSGYELTSEQSLSLASFMAQILASLEQKGVAHCDIASGNVMVAPDYRQIHLVDVEDMFIPNIKPPAAIPIGTAGYQHKYSRTNMHGQWLAEGDRFAGAVIMAEILAWHDTDIRKRAEGEHYFSEAEMQDSKSERYQLMLKVLRNISPELSELFREAWCSTQLESCPKLNLWLKSTNKLTKELSTVEILKSLRQPEQGKPIQGVEIISIESMRPPPSKPTTKSEATPLPYRLEQKPSPIPSPRTKTLSFLSLIFVAGLGVIVLYYQLAQTTSPVGRPTGQTQKPETTTVVQTITAPTPIASATHATLTSIKTFEVVPSKVIATSIPTPTLTLTRRPNPSSTLIPKPTLTFTPQPTPTATLTRRPPATPTSSPKPTPRIIVLSPIAAKGSGTSDCGFDSHSTPICYMPENVIDGKTDTAWRANSTSRPWIELELAQTATLTGIKMISGYNKIDPYDGTDRWLQNHRPRHIRISFDGQYNKNIELLDQRDWQIVKLDGFTAQRIRIEVLDTYAPVHKDPRSYVAISEIIMIGNGL